MDSVRAGAWDEAKLETGISRCETRGGPDGGRDETRSAGAASAREWPNSNAVELDCARADRCDASIASAATMTESADNACADAIDVTSTEPESEPPTAAAAPPFFEAPSSP